MPGINPKIVKTIQESKYPEDIKRLLLALLNVELRNKGDGYAHYSDEYDRKLSEVVKGRGVKGDE